MKELLISMDEIYEMCPHCGTEVVIDSVFDVQICPSCGRPILPCSLCESCSGWNTGCPLRDKEKIMEKEFGLEMGKDETIKATTVYKVGDTTSNILECIQLGGKLYGMMQECLYSMHGRMCDDKALLEAYMPFKEYMMKQLGD